MRNKIYIVVKYSANDDGTLEDEEGVRRKKRVMGWSLAACFFILPPPPPLPGCVKCMNCGTLHYYIRKTQLWGQDRRFSLQVTQCREVRGGGGHLDSKD